jgi:hypothetical protein
MLRLIAATVLVVHLLFMFFIAASGKGLLVAAAIACYVVLLIFYFRKRSFSPVVLAGLVIYLAVLLVAYVALVIGSFEIGRPANIWFHSFVFLPGIIAVAAYIGYVLEDRKRQLATAR